MAENGTSDGPADYRTADTPAALPGLAVVGVKLLGLHALIQGLPLLSHLPELLREIIAVGGAEWMRLTYTLPYVLYLGLGILLLSTRGSGWIVTHVARVPAGDVPPITVNEHLQGIAFSVVGVLLMTWGGGALVGQLAESAVVHAQRGAGNPVPDLGYARHVYPLVELIAGAFLFFRGRGLASLWHAMRYGGVRVRPAE